ncbi:hypothetical protein P154DRAFT_258973 [Amniculicola lignicola CBS 123094]|uniref:Uncharacterized protein n=1 Tax=Amniculicola lignicola CBS 123094 TaxID=1392246 RepID=A0A6A5X013_9PLEO|nr:hypothetical protein P154DRAFT_258973 [Amniculicola lignicola CBS 123094]
MAGDPMGLLCSHLGPTPPCGCVPGGCRLPPCPTSHLNPFIPSRQPRPATCSEAFCALLRKLHRAARPRAEDGCRLLGHPLGGPSSPHRAGALRHPCLPSDFAQRRLRHVRQPRQTSREACSAEMEQTSAEQLGWLLSTVMHLREMHPESSSQRAC